MVASRSKQVAGLLAGVFMAMSGVSAAQGADKVLRIVPQSDLKILDPIWTTAFTTRNHGYMIYDTLFGIDANGKIQPEMIDKYTVSPDQKVWTFTLRKELSFNDGKAVTSDDVIASIKRWGQRDPMGQRMLGAIGKFEAVDASTFRMSFDKPFALVVEALSKPSSVTPFIMPRRVAETPADKQIDDTTGSGPYMFKKDEYRPGEKVVYVKNPKYVPRAEPASGTAGGKRVFVDRVEWVILKDAQTQANALANGEVDMIEWLPAEQYAQLKANPKIVLATQIKQATVAMHINHLIPPFNNPKIARAAFLAVNQEAIMRAQQVHKELYSTCTSIYPCGTEFASDKTGGYTGKPRFEESKKLLKEAGYDGTPVVLLYPADFAVINKYPPVMAALLKQAGFTVEMQSMDWPTLVSRRANKGPVSQGGWNMFITSWGLADMMNPLFMAPLTGNGDKGFFGWATDAKLEALKDQFQGTVDPAQRKVVATEIQERVFDAAIYAPLGEFKPMVAYRKDVVSGLVPAPVAVFWNLKKN
jgi:peptide/nickel transport system substrate-binding protein